MTSGDGDVSDNEPVSGDSLPPHVLPVASLCAVFATLLSLYSIMLQLVNYRKPLIQRWVVRIMCMIPIFSMASMIALYSLEAAFLIDLLRDLYEAFVIYCFFSLLITYLGGERSLLIMLHGREPTPHPWPVNKFLAPLDLSDPFSFLFLKRGILQYVQIKPVLAVITVILKATGTYADGQFEANAGYTYISVVYNFSVSLSLYCLAMFWVCTTHDLQPFRPMPKFICVKSLVFATFWQGAGVSILVRANILQSRQYGDENYSIALQDSILCFEMPLFAVLHLYAFSHRDYLPSKTRTYSGRLPFMYAFRDSLLGYKDVLDDSLTTFRGTGFSYRTFEPAEGGLHSATGDARARRARAGLRYADGGKTKYWLPMPGADVEEAYGRHLQRAPLLKYTGTDATDRLVEIVEHPVKNTAAGRGFAELLANPIQTIGRRIRERRDADRGYAPIAPEQADEVIHQDPRFIISHEAALRAQDLETTSGMVPLAGAAGMMNSHHVIGRDPVHDGESSSMNGGLEFGEPDDEEEKLYSDARQLEYGDFNYPILDASKEEARRAMREMEDAFIKGRSREWRVSKALEQREYRRTSSSSIPKVKKKGKNKAINEARKLPEGCVDILVEDYQAEEEEQVLERGEPSLRTSGPKRVFRRTYGTLDGDSSAKPVTFPRYTPTLPKTPPAEEETDPHQIAEHQSEGAKTVGAPEFARLHHLSDGTDFIDTSTLHAEGHGEHAAVDLEDNDMEEEIVSNERRRKNRNSAEPSYNPWG